MATAKPALTPVQKLIQSKQRLLKRYDAEETDIQVEANRQLARLELKRIQTKALITVLEKGTRLGTRRR